MAQGVQASGTQHTLRADGYEATIASVGASLRRLTHQRRDLVVPFAADEIRPAYRGATLAPWPNRIVDGRYVFDGAEHRAPLNEPERGHALHGLVCWADFVAVDESETHVTLAATIVPQDAYPWRVTVETTFAFSDDGLTQTVTARNDGASPAPFGTGPHPYLVAGPGPVDAWSLELPAGEVLLVTDERLIPTDLVPVAADAERFDFRDARLIGSVEIDHAYTAIARGQDGRATVRLTDASGSGVRMTWDERCPWVQVHTADLPGHAPGHRAGLAVEPMTCPPDAFNSGTDLLVIEPGASASASWMIGAITA